MRLIKLVFEGTADEYLVVREQFAAESPFPPLTSSGTTTAGPTAPALTADAAMSEPSSSLRMTSETELPDVVAPASTKEQADSPTSSPQAADDAEVPAAATTPPEVMDFTRVMQRGLPDSVRRLLMEVATGGEAGVNRSDLRSALGIKDGELNGVLGTLGRRINGTPNLHFTKGKGTNLALVFDIWNDDGWHYRLKPEARQVLENEGLLT